MSDNKVKVTFAPGCFDSFDGSQEELDELVAEITRLAESGELMEESVDISDVLDEISGQDLDALFDNTDTSRKLQ